MSLAPGEQQALAQIESRLRSCDPGLALMLDQFGRKVAERSARQAAGRSRWPRTMAARTRISGLRARVRLPRLLAIAAAIVLLGALWAIVLTRSNQPSPARACRLGTLGLTGCHHPGGAIRRHQAHQGGPAPAGRH